MTCTYFRRNASRFEKWTNAQNLNKNKIISISIIIKLMSMSFSKERGPKVVFIKNYFHRGLL